VTPAAEAIHVDENVLPELTLVVECNLSGFKNHLMGKNISQRHKGIIVVPQGHCR
jgi:hypothetical protein